MRESTRTGHVAIFWDYENCHPPTNASGYDIVDKIRRAVEIYGSIIHFKAYLDVSLSASTKSSNLYAELQDSGVTLAHCPHSGRKDVVDKMILVDMMAYTHDKPSPFTIVLITGDRDLTYGISTLRLRGYDMVVIVPPSAHSSIVSIATFALGWQSDIINAVVGTTPGLNAEKDGSALKAPNPPCKHCSQNSTSLRMGTAASHFDSDHMKWNPSSKEISETPRISELFTFIPKFFLIVTTITSVWDIFRGFLKVLWGDFISVAVAATFLYRRRRPGLCSQTQDGRVASDVNISAADGIFDSENGFCLSHYEGSDEKVGGFLPLTIETSPRVTQNDQLGMASQGLTQISTVCAYPKAVFDDELDVLYYDALETQGVLSNPDNETRSCEGVEFTGGLENGDEREVDYCAETETRHEMVMSSVRSNVHHLPAMLASAVSPVTPNVHTSSVSGVPRAIEASGSAVVSRTVAAAVIADPPFKPLIEILNNHEGKRVERSILGQSLKKKTRRVVFNQAGVSNFKKYIEAAVLKGYVTVGGEYVTLASNVK